MVGEGELGEGGGQQGGSPPSGLVRPLLSFFVAFPILTGFPRIGPFLLSLLIRSTYKEYDIPRLTFSQQNENGGGGKMPQDLPQIVKPSSLAYKPLLLALSGIVHRRFKHKVQTSFHEEDL